MKRDTLNCLVERITPMCEIQALLRAESWVEIVGWSMDLPAAPLPFHLLPAVDSLGISDELKEKLEDVLIPEQQFTLGRMLGKGMGAGGRLS